MGHAHLAGDRLKTNGLWTPGDQQLFSRAQDLLPRLFSASSSPLQNLLLDRSTYDIVDKDPN